MGLRFTWRHLIIVVITSISNHYAIGSDFYNVLGVDRSASNAEIRQAYRKLAKDLHPDRNPSADAAARFTEVAAAYEVLGDDSKRATYNRDGEEGLKRAQRQQEQRSQGGFSSLFEAFGFGRREAQEARTPNVEIPVRCSLKSLYLGDSWDVVYSRRVLCLNHKDCERSCPDCYAPGIKVVSRQVGPGFVQQVS